MKSLLVAFFGILCVPAFAQQNNDHSESDPWSIVGIWQCSHPAWSDTIVIRKDGTFSRQQVEDAGRWALTSMGDRIVLILAWDRWSASVLSMVNADEFQAQVENGTMVARRQSPVEALTLEAKDAKLSGSIRYDGTVKNIGYWIEAGASCSWTIPALEPGMYNVLIEYALSNESAGGQFDIRTEGSRKTVAGLGPTGDWDTYRTRALTSIFISAEDRTFSLVATKILPSQSLLNLKTVFLIKSR